VDNIKMDLREIGWDGVDWIDMAQYRDQWRALVNTVLNLRVPQNAGGVLEGLHNSLKIRFNIIAPPMRVVPFLLAFPQTSYVHSSYPHEYHRP
jgi:hypothetical protein